MRQSAVGLRAVRFLRALAVVSAMLAATVVAATGGPAQAAAGMASQ
jgi:hypothetical protein